MVTLSKFAALAFALVFLSAVFLFIELNFSPTGQFTLLFASQQLQIDSLSVYQSSDITIGSGSPVCTLVDLTGTTASCSGTLNKATTYRFEVNVSNPGTVNSKPPIFDFYNVYALNDVIGLTDVVVLSCGCYDDGTYRAGTTQLVGSNVKCSLPTGTSGCNVQKNGEGTNVFYFVIRTGTDAGSQTGFFYIEEPTKTSDTSADISFTYCSPACDTNAACNDSNSLTTDICLNPGACSAACSNVPCSVACTINANCNDGNVLTVDTCNNPSTCGASCSHSSCSVACDTNAQCADSNSLTIDVCNNPGACSAACSHAMCSVACDLNSQCNDSNSLTIDVCNNPSTCGASCSNTACSVACDLNSQCNDSNASTTDLCLNPGTCSASCSYTACSVACASASACDDSNSLTVDSCVNSGTCSSYCSHSTCTIACSSAGGCDDSNSLTTDACNNPGTCSASCSNTACSVACASDSDCDDGDDETTDTCLNSGTCDAECSNAVPTIACSVDSDCDDGDPLTTDSCYRPGTLGARCMNEYAEEQETEPDCRVDSDCDDSNPLTVDSCYRPGTAGARCLNEYGEGSGQQEPGTELSIEFVDALPESTSRGSSLSVVVRVLDSAQSPVSGASVSLADANGSSVELTPLPGGKYSGRFVISPGYPLGEQVFTVAVQKGSEKKESSFSVSVGTAEILIEIVSPAISKQPVGAVVDFRVKLSYPDGSVVDDANVVAVADGEQIYFVSESNGIFVASYPLGSDDLGLLELKVSAVDSAGNAGATTISVDVLTPEQYAWFIVGLLFLLLLILVLLLLMLLFYMRFEHILKLERQRAKLLLMKKHAQVLIATTNDPVKKKDLLGRAEYLDKLVKKNENSLKLMRKRSWLTLGDIPMDLFFGTRALLYDILHVHKILRGKKMAIANKQKLQEIDSKIADLREMIARIENDFYKQLIAPDEFKKRLFDYREKIHLLEIERKKLR